MYVIKKAEKKWWDRLIKQEGKPPVFLKVDWDKWVDEEEENGKHCDCELVIIYCCLCYMWFSIMMLFLKITERAGMDFDDMDFSVSGFFLNKKLWPILNDCFLNVLMRLLE